MAGEIGQVARMIDQLAKLNEKRPDICRANLAPTPVKYFIGEYGFWGNSAGELIACPMGLLDKNIGGRFALAWLRDAIEGEIERLRLDYTSDFWFYKDAPRWRVYPIDLKRSFLSFESYIDALLAAFLAAVEEDGR